MAKQLKTATSTRIEPVQLDLRVEALMRRSLQENTYLSYRSALNGFIEWLDRRVPQDELVATYIAERFQAGASPATIALVVSAIKYLAKSQGVESPVGEVTKTTEKGIRRSGRYRGRGQAEALTYDDLHKILATAHLARAGESEEKAYRRGLLDSAIASLLFMAGLRVSELARLQWGDLKQGDQFDHLLVLVRESKGNQEGEEDLRLVKGDAAQSLLRLRESRGQNGGGQPSERIIGLSTRQISRRLQGACFHAGIEGRITSHSGRIGLASELLERGASAGSIALAGGWGSEKTVLHYAKRARVEKGAVATYF